MHTRPILLPFRMLIACALGACLAAPLAMAAGSGAALNTNDIEARYKADIERCKAGQTNQDKPTCIREAGAAREEANRNRLSNNGNPQTYDMNEKARCQALPTAERNDCMLQMSGQNTSTQGSVGGGGVLRETTITTTGTPVPAPGAAPVTPAPGLTSSPPAVVPAPSLTPVPPATIPGTGPN